MNYEKAYKDALERAKRGLPVEEVFSELKESEDERIRKGLIAMLSQDKELHHKEIAYLEKQKEASKAIEAVDRIDKYIDERLANAHEMSDSDPDKKYYSGWDDALGRVAGILQDVYSEGKKKEHKSVEHFDLTKLIVPAKRPKEQKPISLPKGGNSVMVSRILHSLCLYRDMLKNSDYEKDYVKVTISQCLEDETWLRELNVEQKPAEWSEEDEKKVHFLSRLK